MWKKGKTFAEICQSYVDYVVLNFGKDSEVVFDGYPMLPTTKDTTHVRRSKGKKGKVVKFSLNSKLSMNKDNFLLNKENKQAFIECLITYMNSRNITAFQLTGDTDNLLVRTAIAACSSHNFAVIGEDTDILILLIHHYVNSLQNDIFFMTDKNLKEKKVWKIKDVKDQLPDKIVDCILPIHAVLGCNTVSRVHSIGKGEESFKKIMSNPEILNNLFKFNEQDAIIVLSVTAGE